MKKTLSPQALTTLQAISIFKKNNKIGPTISELAYYMRISYDASQDRVSKLVKAKKIGRDKKTGLITIKK